MRAFVIAQERSYDLAMVAEYRRWWTWSSATAANSSCAAVGCPCWRENGPSCERSSSNSRAEPPPRRGIARPRIRRCNVVMVDGVD